MTLPQAWEELWCFHWGLIGWDTILDLQHHHWHFLAFEGVSTLASSFSLIWSAPLKHWHFCFCWHPWLWAIGIWVGLLMASFFLVTSLDLSIELIMGFLELKNRPKTTQILFNQTSIDIMKKRWTFFVTVWENKKFIWTFCQHLLKHFLWRTYNSHLT